MLAPRKKTTEEEKVTLLRKQIPDATKQWIQKITDDDTVYSYPAPVRDLQKLLIMNGITVPMLSRMIAPENVHLCQRGKRCPLG